MADEELKKKEVKEQPQATAPEAAPQESPEPSRLSKFASNAYNFGKAALTLPLDAVRDAADASRGPLGAFVGTMLNSEGAQKRRREAASLKENWDKMQEEARLKRQENISKLTFNAQHSDEINQIKKGEIQEKRAEQEFKKKNATSLEQLRKHQISFELNNFRDAHANRAKQIVLKTMEQSPDYQNLSVQGREAVSRSAAVQNNIAYVTAGRLYMEGDKEGAREIARENGIDVAEGEDGRLMVRVPGAGEGKDGWVELTPELMRQNQEAIQQAIQGELKLENWKQIQYSTCNAMGKAYCNLMEQVSKYTNGNGIDAQRYVKGFMSQFDDESRFWLGLAQFSDDYTNNKLTDEQLDREFASIMPILDKLGYTYDPAKNEVIGRYDGSRMSIMQFKELIDSKNEIKRIWQKDMDAKEAAYIEEKNRKAAELDARIARMAGVGKGNTGAGDTPEQPNKKEIYDAMSQAYGDDVYKLQYDKLKTLNDTHEILKTEALENGLIINDNGKLKSTFNIQTGFDENQNDFLPLIRNLANIEQVKLKTDGLKIKGFWMRLYDDIKNYRKNEINRRKKEKKETEDQLGTPYKPFNRREKQLEEQEDLNDYYKSFTPGMQEQQ